MINKKNKIALILLIGILLIPTVLSYSSSNAAYTQPGFSSVKYLQAQGIEIYPQLDPDKCGAGQDLILQINPTGCTPSIVRSDLLEEQNVPVFCPIIATKVNPLIQIDTINSINLQKQSSSPEVQGVGFQPANAAIATSKTFINSPVLSNIGYAVIVLRQQKNETSMPDYVTGTIKANIKYDIENSFGTGKAVYYLPILSDSEWNENYQQYSFWKGKGFLRAESINDNTALISIYQDSEKRFSSANLNQGELSNEIYLPGYYCLARMQLRLEGIESPDTRARLRINDENIEAKKGEKFLDNKCTVTNLQKTGIVDSVTIQCNDDQKSKPFQLVTSPKIKITINGETKDYQIGDKLYVSDDPNKYVYLAGIYSKTQSYKSEDLQIFLLKAPVHDEKLSIDTINSMKSIFNNYLKGQRKGATGIRIIDFVLGTGKAYTDTTKEIYKWLIDGESVDSVEYGKEVTFAGGKVSVAGFGNYEDKAISDNFKKSFDDAINQYRELSQQFPSELITDETSDFAGYAEKGLWEAQELARKTEQFGTRKELLEEFIQKYPNSKLIDQAKQELESYLNSNSQINTATIFVDGKTKVISFERIIEPSADDYGAVINVNGQQYEVGKNERIYVNENTNEYFELLEAKEDSVRISLVGIDHSGIKQTLLYDPQGATIKLNDFQVVGNNQYRIGITQINLNKLAKVSLNPRFTYEGTETNFTFKIGIEKRAIQLSPDQIKSKIENLDSQLEKWTSISKSLDDTTKAFKTACLATGTYFTVRNFLSDSSGRSIARQKVMRNAGGWNDFCTSQVSQGKYASMDSCYYENADAIDADVSKLTDIIQTQNGEIKETQDKFVESTFAGKVVNKDEFVEEYLPSVKEDLGKITSVSDGKNIINVADAQKSLIFDSWNASLFSTEQLRDIQLNSRILNSDASTEMKQMAEKSLYSALFQVQADSKNFVDKNNFAKQIGISADQIPFLEIGKDNKKLNYYELTLNDVSEIFPNPSLDPNTPISIVQTSDGNKYIAVLDNSIGGNILPIKREGEQLSIYDSNGNVVSNVPDELKKVYFQKFDATSYQNTFQNPELKYFEIGDYKGYPAIVPFDTKNGWYVALRQTLPILGNVKAYDDSGRVASFYLCNVGQNGRQQFNEGIADDDCELINLNTRQLYTTFPGLTQDQTSKLVNNAVSAIEQSQRAYKSGVKSVRISTTQGTYNMNVGEPATSSSELQCQDFMSPKDCYALFNVCDPVICPSSRCDLGGTYHVSDVIQSGIVGSIALCFPNYKEKIIVPVCLSGINAGVQNFVSMFSSYRDCLQESLDTGQQVGVCDQINSIYLCEFFWRQTAPLSGNLIPEIIQSVTGQGTRGGGEYLNVLDSWQNAQNSLNYLTQYYGANSYQSFKTRTTEDVGSAVCKVFTSVRYPASGDFIDSLIEPDSPVQYTAWYSEIPFTTTTNPPISQYKVYYHIYAGKNEGSYYKVYLKSTEGGSYYQDNPSILVSSGYLGVGQSADETRDLTAPSGYQQLCISINAKEECGFKQVSTSFVSDYVKDSYVKEQISNINIKTEAECISGDPSVYSLINPNLQEGINEVANPQLYNYGIVRVCSTEDPGKQTDANSGTPNSRWKSVGVCGNQNIKCWVDTQSVKDVVSISSIENQTLSDITNSYLDAIKQQGGYLTDSQFKNQTDRLDANTGGTIDKGTYDETKLNSDIKNIDLIFDKILLSDQKAKLLGYKARALNKLVYNIWKYYAIQETVPVPTATTPTTTTPTETTPTGTKTTTVVQGATLNANQLEVGNQLIKIAQQIKEDKNIDDSSIETDTSISKFECLILMQALRESSLTQCYNAKDDPFYCEGDLTNTFKSQGNDYGIMQINLGAHPDATNLVSSFNGNAEYGINYLITLYNGHKGTQTYTCKNTQYSGWQLALRYYNGWSPNDCSKGDKDYVENVLANKATIGKNFPDFCGGLKVTTTTASGYILDNNLKILSKDNQYMYFYLDNKNLDADDIYNIYINTNDNNSRLSGTISKQGQITISTNTATNSYNNNPSYYKINPVDIANDLNQNYIFANNQFVKKTGETTTVQISSNETAMRNDIIASAKSFVKIFFPQSFKDKFVYVDSVYAKVIVQKQCVWSEENKIHQKVDTTKVGISSGGTSYQHLSCSQCQSCTVNQYDLKKGDVIQFYAGSLEENNAVFEQWSDQSKKIALVYGVKTNSRPAEHYTVNFNNNPVTMVWEPDLSTYRPSATSTQTQTTQIPYTLGGKDSNGNTFILKNGTNTSLKIARVIAPTIVSIGGMVVGEIDSDGKITFDFGSVSDATSGMADQQLIINNAHDLQDNYLFKDGKFVKKSATSTQTTGTTSTILTKCSDCGKGFTKVCQEDECLTIAQNLHKINTTGYCIFEDKSFFPGGTCTQENYFKITGNFSSSELNVITNSVKCSDCGRGISNACDSKECAAIGEKLKISCKFTPNPALLNKVGVCT